MAEGGGFGPFPSGERFGNSGNYPTPLDCPRSMQTALLIGKEPVMFILYSTRGQGWLTKSSSYSSDRTQAKEFTPPETLDLCALHLRSGHTLLPIRLTDMQEIQRFANAQR